MGFLKYWYFSVFFIANGILGESTLEGLINATFRTEVKTQFYITGSKCKSSFCQIDYNNFNCCDNLKNNRRLTVLIHGFSRDYKEEWMSNMKDELIKKPNMNVIAINWVVQRYLGQILVVNNSRWYSDVFKHTPTVANLSAEFLAHTITKNIGKLDHLHILGHSMGGHIAGQIADILKKNHSISVDRITGLDPALPCFDDYSKNLTLRPSHANFVDIIHTNSRSKEDSTYGIYRSLGHVDIYPNGGNNQPGCPLRNDPIFPTPSGQPVLSALSALVTCEATPDLLRNIIRSHGYLWCNHFKAPEYMVLSMKHEDCQFLAVPLAQKGKSADIICRNGSCVEMGIKAENYKTSRGQYYINMNDMVKSKGNCFV